MATQFSPKVIGAIYTLIQAGQSIDDTREALLDGTVPGLKALPESECPSRSTIAYHARKARAEMEPVPDAETFANALEQQTIRIVRREMRRLEGKAEMSEANLRELERLLAIKDKVRGRGFHDSKKPGPQRGGKKSTDPEENHNILDRIGKGMADNDDDSGNGAGPVANGAGDNGGGGTGSGDAGSEAVPEDPSG